METINTPNKPGRIKRAKNRIKDAAKVDVVKTHVSEHREAYIAAVVVGTAGVIAYILKPTDGSVDASIGVTPEIHGDHNAVTTFIMQMVNTPGNSGDRLFDPATKCEYASKNQAAKELDIPRKSVLNMIEKGDLIPTMPGDMTYAPKSQ